MHRITLSYILMYFDRLLVEIHKIEILNERQCFSNVLLHVSIFVLYTSFLECVCLKRGSTVPPNNIKLSLSTLSKNTKIMSRIRNNVAYNT